MISKSKIKYIHSLELKKYRKAAQAFVAEGNKLVADMLTAFKCEYLLAKQSWIDSQDNLSATEIEIEENKDIHKASFLKNPQDVLAIFKLPTWDIQEVAPSSSLVLALDGIQDPGNFGTIVRLADWFGIRHIICSSDTVDAFSPKAVQATMGALSRVKVYYTDLGDYLLQASHTAIPVYGTFLDGENLYSKKLSANGIIVMGNEGNGIRPQTKSLINNRLWIPNYPQGEATSESLNVAMATAVICAEFRRRQMQ